MKKILSMIAVSAAAALCFTAASADTAEGIRYITIDSSSADRSESRAWKGIGGSATGGAASLLDDYKYSSPEEYEEIVNILFRKGVGAGLSHIRVEMGSDVNSASGTESCIMRRSDELSEKPLSAGWQLAADAKKINPGLTVTMTCKSEPGWVTDAFENGVQAGYNARYIWYRSHIEKAYNELGLKIDCISADNGELSRADPEWILYLSRRLDTETESLYDYKMIKIMASDSTDGSGTAELMLSDDQLFSAVDVISCRYTALPSESADILSRKYGKELWFTDGAAPTSADMYSRNGILGTADTIIGSVCSGRMSMYELSPAVSAYYSGTRYFPSGIITADSPFSGAYETEYGVCTAAHFTAFTDIGWQPVNSACAYNGADISAGLPVKDNYITFTDPEYSDYTTIISNSGTADRKYVFRINNMKKADETVNIWQTYCNDEGELILMEKLGSITPENVNGSYAYEFTAKAGSLTTLTTTDRDIRVSGFCSTDKETLSLPYSDGFDSDSGYYSVYGSAPLYSHTTGGAFEAENGMLVQKLTEDIIPSDRSFGITPDPILSLGDDTWKDYSAKITVKLDNSEKDNYAGIGLRCSAFSDEQAAFSGYTFIVTGVGEWKLFRHSEIISSGIITGFSSDKKYTLQVTVSGRSISADINDTTVTEVTEESFFINSGRVSLVSAYYKNSFDDLFISAADDDPYVKRTENTVKGVDFTGSLVVSCDDSYVYFGRSYTTLDSGIEIHDTPEKIHGSFANFFFSDADTVEIYGTGLAESKIFLDNMGYNAECTDDRIIIKAPDDEYIHRLHVIASNGGNIEYAVSGRQGNGSTVEFDFAGTAFALIGECNESSEIRIKIDGKEYASETVIPKAPPRSALCSADGLENTEHNVKITLTKGSISVDAIETDTNDTLIKNNDGSMPELPPVEQPPSEETVSMTEKMAETEEKAEAVSTDRSGNKAVPIISICGIGAAVGVYAAIKKHRRKQ
ncbi:MAG: hypothetical protein IJ446_09520 [Oscillospiraceae bacterium]|nr:hypothetical protein [Oscillospiraceae bacterium]